MAFSSASDVFLREGVFSYLGLLRDYMCSTRQQYPVDLQLEEQQHSMSSELTWKVRYSLKSSILDSREHMLEMLGTSFM